MRSSNAMLGRQKTSKTRFVRRINSILQQLQSASLNKFVVKFALRKRHTAHIDRWVNFSVASRTKHLVLDLCPGMKVSSIDTDDMYTFPLHLFDASSGSCVKSLRLGFVYLMPLPDLCGFANLKKLSLHMVTITGEFSCLVPVCAVLEWLSITRCRMAGLSIAQELSQLHYLCVQFCFLLKLEIRAPNLVTFMFNDHAIPIMLGEPLKISEATIGLFSSSDCFNYVFTDLVNALSHVQSLSINFKINTEVCSAFMVLLPFLYAVRGGHCLSHICHLLMLQVLGFVKNPTRLTNLRLMILKIDISGWPETTGGILRLAYILKLAPFLEELVLHMYYLNLAIPVLQTIEDTSPPHPHSHLKTIRMTGFYGLHGQLELALYLLRNATSLKCMVIDPVVRNSSYIPPLVVAEKQIYQGRITARTKLWRNNEFRGVLEIL
ncbi:unnamed protein product [Triticum turgidum subsp. durum]|uniref:At1g61320/AtMIF1 LRR domain-containing protein n=1 Tax=Triticum turgidum subsp. durum TaxID=4567 RepID=A0A9R1P1S2_TRITD|nr:unnamed protein product [Triticum turgidum subsp. durum]